MILILLNSSVLFLILSRNNVFVSSCRLFFYMKPGLLKWFIKRGEDVKKSIYGSVMLEKF